MLDENKQGEIIAEECQDNAGVVYKHEKDGLSIYITIYNTNNNANEGSEAGLKQRASEGGQITGKGGKNANQGGQIAGNCGQNANQDGEVTSDNCGGCMDVEPEEIAPSSQPTEW